MSCAEFLASKGVKYSRRSYFRNAFSSFDLDLRVN